MSRSVLGVWVSLLFLVCPGFLSASTSADFQNNPGPTINVTLTNPGFETTWTSGSNPTGWTRSSSSYFTANRNTTYKKAGSASVALARTTSSSRYIYQNVTVDAGRIYTVSAAFRDAGNGRARVLLYFYNGTSIITSVAGSYTTNSTSFQTKTVSGLAPAKTTKIQIRLEVSDDPAGSRATIYADAVSVVSTSNQGYLDNDANAIWNRPPGFYKDGSYWYAIFHAPATATRVRLEGAFTQWLTRCIDLTKTPDGKFWWYKAADSDFYTVPAAGDTYDFIINGTTHTQDPAARWVQNSGLAAYSKVTKGTYVWNDTDWYRPGWEYYMIYQVHPLRFTSRNGSVTPLQQIIEEIDGDGSNDYIYNLSPTAIELLPVNEFAGDYSWGYNPSFYYACEASYGSPDQLKQLVDTAHQQGMAVILDLVYNHAGTGDNVLWTVDSTTYFDGDTTWGAMINFDNDIARHFFVQNILYLAREYHIDAFRFDATRVMHVSSHDCIRVPGSGGGWEFLREIRSEVRAVDPDILLIAEELPNDWYITQENIGSSWDGDYHGPFDSQWCDPFHDNFKAVLTGDNNLDRLYSVFTTYGDNWQDGLIYSESHDEVGNTDDRIAKRARDGKGWEMCQVSGTGTILGRGIPMVFMGQEAGEWMQFGQNDGDLASYNPGTGTTWWDDRLDLNAYESDAGRTKVRNWFRKMFDIRLANLPAFAWENIQITHVNNSNKICAFTRYNGKYLIIMNFGATSWPNYFVGVTGTYRELANTSWAAYNLGSYPYTSKGTTYQYLNEFAIPAYGAVVLERQ